MGRRGWAMAGTVLAVLPWLFDSSYALTLMSQMAIFVVFALSYNMIFGQCGMLSFGHAVYSGLGAYGAVHALNALTAAGGPWSSPATVALLPLVGGLTGALVGVLLGYPTTRRAGTPFAMITLGLGEMVHAAALMFPGLFGGEGGISTDRAPGGSIAGISFGPAIEVYYLIVAWCLIATALMYRFSQTPLGRIANAVRDNAERVEFIGYPARRVRYLVLIASSFFAGIAGSLAAINFELVTAENLSTLQSGAVLLATYIGGTAWFIGPILGAIVYVLFALALSDYTPAWLFYLGLFFIVMVMYAPGGLAGLIDRNLAVIREGRAATLKGAYAGVAATAIALALPAIVLVEMAYHRALDPTGEAGITVFGLGLDTTSSISWLAAVTAVLVALPLFEQRRRRFVSAWVETWQQIDAPGTGSRPPQAAQAAREPQGAKATREPPAAQAARDADAAGPAAAMTGPVLQAQPPPPAAAVLELSDVHKSFGRTGIIRGVDLSVRQGERLALIGPNGAGKSTLFHLISGRLAPGAGSIRLHGREIAGLAPDRINRLGLARSFQVTNLFPRLTVAENLACASLRSLGQGYSFLRRLSRQADVAARVDQLLEQTGLAARRQVPVAQLSYAEQRALELGVTLAGDAAVILLDEPTAGMSRAESERAVELIRRLSEGRTLVMVEHDMGVVFGLADRVAVLVQGRVIAVDEPARIRADARVQEAYLGQARADR